ncbi:MAG TPA: DUF3568 family protein [Opitutaceae bacterium]|nr:DUF3568 family protein [Opitutaceae bacterium]
MNSSMRRIRLLAAMLVVAPVLVTSGCLAVAAGAAGAGTVAYIRGELDATVGYNLDAVDRAANQAGQQLQFAKINESADAFTRVITLRTAEDKKVEIKLRRSGDALTRVEIRVGLFGDEAISRALLEKIQANL